MCTLRGFLPLYMCITLSECLFVHKQEPLQISSKTKIEEDSTLISTSLGHVVIINVPSLQSNKSKHELFKPNGDIYPLDFYTVKEHKKELKKKKIKYKDQEPPEDYKDDWKYKILKVNDTEDLNNIIDNNLRRRHIVIGPLTEEDHGNWVLSNYYKDLNEDWVEIFQVITIEIVEFVPSEKYFVLLDRGETFTPRFAYPISDLETCQLIPPRTAINKLYYERDKHREDYCAFVVDNVSGNDSGVWEIFALGKIVYRTKVHLIAV